MCLHDQPPTEKPQTLRIEQGFPGQRHHTHIPVVQCQRENTSRVALEEEGLGSAYGTSLKDTYLSFVVINLSYEYNELSKTEPF